MATFSAVVKLGNNSVKIETNNFLELFEAVAAIEELAEATEGENVRLVVRNLKTDKNKTFKKYGYVRNKDNAILDLGMSQDSDRLVPVFPYSKFSADYKGFRKYQAEEDSASKNGAAIPAF